MDGTPHPTPSASISVTDPVSRAWDWTGKVLFKPFDAGKWFVLGFCAWLAWIGQGGGGAANWSIPDDAPSGRFDSAIDWVDANLAFVIAIAVFLFLVVVGVVLLLTWISSRGKLMFLDGVLHNRAAVVEPWHRFRAQANSLFVFRIVVGLLALLVFGVLIGLGATTLVAMGVSDMDFTPAVILIVATWVAILLAVGFVFALVAVALNDIVVPILWLRGCPVMGAWNEFLSLLSAHTGSFVLYVLMKILLAVIMGMLGLLATCLTCCIAALPYIGTVILLPLFVFRRSYSIYFLSQFGPEYAALAPSDTVPEAAAQS